MWFTSSDNNIEKRICAITALAKFLEAYGEKSFTNQNLVMHSISNYKGNDQRYTEAVERVKNAEQVYKKDNQEEEEELPEMDITQLFDEEWLEEASNISDEDEKIERI